MDEILKTLNEYSGLIALLALFVAVASYIATKRSAKSARKSKQAELDAINEIDESPFSGFIKSQPDYEVEIRKRQLKKELGK